MVIKIRKDLDGTVHVTNRLGQRLVLSAGDEVPDGYTVGDHVQEGAAVDESAATPPAPPAGAGAGSGDSGEGDEAVLVAKALERNVAGVKAYADNHPDRVAALLDAEQAGGCRKGVVSHLEKLQAARQS